jgi:hypothetical protein
MHRMITSFKPQRQNGAALVVGLLLLMVLTLLAISGMNTASLELVMAGNTQYQQNAFQAAEGSRWWRDRADDDRFHITGSCSDQRHAADGWAATASHLGHQLGQFLHVSF